MQLVIKQEGNFVREVYFERGPLYIGRLLENQVCLQDVVVSRQHAVLYGADESKWFAEDLDSANKTYLNDKAIHKAEVKDGDVIRIGGFTIEFFIGGKVPPAHQVSMAETATIAVNAPETIVRRYDAKDAPDIKLPPQRARDYAYATLQIFQAKDAAQLLKTLLSIVDKQFNIFRIWIGLRTDLKGPLTLTEGYKNTGQKIDMGNLIFREKITEAFEKGQYVLIPLLPKDKLYEHTRSAVMAPLVGHDGCYGIIYADNATDQRHYSLVDLDYLMLLSIQAAAVMQGK